MTRDAPGALYVGDVVHARITPKRHRLRYKVTALLVDVDRIDELAKSTVGFGYNRRALVSLYDRDYGTGDLTIANHARTQLAAADLSEADGRIRLLTYPRLAGFAFNPVSVFYCEDKSGALRALLYEVNNTFSERKCYVLPTEAVAVDAERQAALRTVHRQHCAKELSVSPFTPGQGTYNFHVTLPDDVVTLGIQYRDSKGPVLRTHFHGRQINLTSMRLVGSVLGQPWSVFKVSAAIHYEAAKLYAKGVPLVRRHRSPRFSVSTPPADRSR